MKLMQETKQKLISLRQRIAEAVSKLALDAEEQRLQQLQQQMRSQDFWDDAQAAAQTSQDATELEKHIQSWRALERQVSDALELIELGDESLLDEVEATHTQLLGQFESKEFELKLSSPHDKGGALLSIYAGTGGTDAQDWAQMLLRMYLRYAERSGWQTEVLSESAGEEAGIKSVTVEINGQYAYGRLKSEKGVHRLVRLSPFNSDNLRQTSFAMVEVIPLLDQPEELAIDPKDLRVDVYRSGGKGGQSVNTTDSAVRVTHLPTGVTVAIQNERSQLQNKEKAMAVLRAKLAAMLAEQHRQELVDLKGPTVAAAWGNQIRSYVLHPYQKVKDHRTGYETSQTQSVLDGQLEELVESYLKSQIGK